MAGAEQGAEFLPFGDADFRPDWVKISHPDDYAYDDTPVEAAHTDWHKGEPCPHHVACFDGFVGGARWMWEQQTARITALEAERDSWIADARAMVGALWAVMSHPQTVMAEISAQSLARCIEDKLPPLSVPAETE